MGYVSRLIARDAVVVPAMRTLAGQYPRYGYRTVRIFLRRQGHVMSADRAYRLWRQEGLQSRSGGRAPSGDESTASVPPTARKSRLAYDFVFDTCATAAR